MKRAVQYPEVKTSNSPTRDTIETHPAYASINASRVNGRAVLYGSDFSHNGYIEIQIAPSELCRGLSRDWHHSRRPYIAVQLSEAQWATFVSTLNHGSGTPCTLDYFNGEDVPRIPEPPKRKEQFSAEVKNTMQGAIDDLKELDAQLDGLQISEKKRKELRSKLQQTLYDISSNLEFVMKQFNEHTGILTEHAKIEVEAHLARTVQQAGLQTLRIGPDCAACGGSGSLQNSDGSRPSCPHCNGMGRSLGTKLSLEISGKNSE